MGVLTPEQEASVRTQFAPGGPAAEAKTNVVEGKVQLPPTLSVKELAEYLNVKTVDIIKELMRNGIMANINQQIDFDTAAIVADTFGVQATPMAMDSAIAEEIVGEGESTQVKLTTRSELFSLEGEDPGNLKVRPPVVTVMGHVDQRQDLAAGCDSPDEGRRRRSGRHYAEHRRLRRRGAWPPDRVPGHPGPRGLHRHARPRRAGYRRRGAGGRRG